MTIQSTNAGAINRHTSVEISSATHFMCFVVSKTSGSSWVPWEIVKTEELKKLVAAKTASNNKTPNGLLDAGASGAMSLAFAAAKKAIEGA